MADQPIPNFTRPKARAAYRWMMAAETGDTSWHTLDVRIVDEMIWRDFGHDDWAAILEHCRQWVPTLYTEDGTAVDPELAVRAHMKPSGTVGVIARRAPCNRCGGHGGWQGWPGFTCYRCGGRDSHWFETVNTTVWTESGLERLRAARARATTRRLEKEAKEAQEREESIQALVAAHPHLQALLDADPAEGSFLASVRDQLRTKGALSERQIAAVAAALDRAQARREKAAQSEHVGTVGERLTIPVRVAFVRDLDGHYGPKRLVKLEDGQGNILVTFATSAWVWEVDRGDELNVTGTVKAHEIYEGSAQTVLTRTRAW